MNNILHKNNDDYKRLELSRKWIKRNTINNQGIVITSKQRIIYQEVTGYFIPTLINWGMKKTAIDFATYLCSHQQDSGAWLSNDLRNESVFNTGQVIRGLVSIIPIMPQAIDNLKKSSYWLVGRINDAGRMVSTEGTIWPDNGMNSELIHLYCLPPLVEAGKLLNDEYLIEKAMCSKKYYITEYVDDILNFRYLSHFYAYVLEALVDLDEKNLVNIAMKKMSRRQRIDGAISAYDDVHWICSTGLFQLAIVWFKLGIYNKGLKAFNYAASLQNNSGGWYGGYRFTQCEFINNMLYASEKITYFPDEEISWAVKYFLDALYLKKMLEQK